MTTPSLQDYRDGQVLFDGFFDGQSEGSFTIAPSSRPFTVAIRAAASASATNTGSGEVHAILDLIDIHAVEPMLLKGRQIEGEVTLQVPLTSHFQFTVTARQVSRNSNVTNTRLKVTVVKVHGNQTPWYVLQPQK